MEQLYTTGWPASGNRWIGRLLARSLGTESGFSGSYLRESDKDKISVGVLMTHSFAEHELRDWLFKGHFLAYKSLWPQEKLLFIARDPRDCFVSSYFFENRHNPGKYRNMIDFFHRFWARENGWREFYEGWLEAQPCPVWTSHETFFADQESELRRVLKELDIEAEEEKVKLACRMSIEPGEAKRSEYINGTQWWKAPRVAPAGQVGIWQQYFDSELEKLMYDYCGHIMEELGYVEKRPMTLKRLPEFIIVLLTWCGPTERGLRETRLKYCQKTVDSLRKYLICPEYDWHIADDGSDEEYQKSVIAMLGNDPYMLSNTEVGGDVGYNINMGLRKAFKKADVVLLWHDDRWLARDLDLRLCVKLLNEDENVGLIRLKPQRPGMRASSFERYGEKWWQVDKHSRCAHIVDIGPHLLHKRFVEAYGLYPTGLHVPLVDDWIDLRVRRQYGPNIIGLDSRWRTVEIPWGSKSTWE